MEWIVAALAIVVLGVAAIAAAGRLGSLPEPDDDVYAPTFPDGPLAATDVRDVRFGVAVRGYDMAQVDAFVARVADQLPASVDRAAESTAVPAEPATETGDRPIDEPSRADTGDARQVLGLVRGDATPVDAR